eukprot:TRINITY_DN36242_c0_g3_i3.p2 TRINITY_DN36242_c0_g3~~TRINITY_DN36242_c0_g3_i3.p2  ORF type:complete len:172 (+),score=82.55 TRINITY_DN36242_c0_g3_i3:113-628(+)
MASGVLAEAALILGYEDVKEMEEAAAAAEGGLEALLSARMSSLCEHLTETALQRDEDAEKVRQLSFALAREAQAGNAAEQEAVALEKECRSLDALVVEGDEACGAAKEEEEHWRLKHELKQQEAAALRRSLQEARAALLEQKEELAVSASELALRRSVEAKLKSDLQEVRR